MTNESDPASKPPANEPNRRVIWLGGAAGIAPALAVALAFWSHSRLQTRMAVLLLTASVTLWPLAAVVLACIRPSRRFGLGMLLGVGLGWLTMLAICGGTLLHG